MHHAVALSLTLGMLCAAPVLAADPHPAAPSSQPAFTAQQLRDHLDDLEPEVLLLRLRQPDATNTGELATWQLQVRQMEAHLRFLLGQVAGLAEPEGAALTQRLQLLRARLAGQGAAQVPRAEVQPRTGATGAIAGRVTTTKGHALAGVRVTVWTCYLAPAGTALTSQSGRYTVTGLDPSDCYFAFTSNQAGFVDQLYGGVPCPGGPFVGCGDPERLGTALFVSPGGTTTGIDFRLGPGGAISGRVRRALDGSPLARVDVRLWDATGTLRAATATDGTGRYRFSGLLPAPYFLSTSNQLGLVDEVFRDLPCGGPIVGDRCQPLLGQAVVASAGTTVPDIDFRLGELSSITGTVTDAATSAPIPFVDLIVSNSQGIAEAFGFTDENGRFATSGIPPGDYFLTTFNIAGYVNEAYPDAPCVGICNPFQGTPISVPLAAQVSANLALDFGGSIAGRVTVAATGAPPPMGSTVELRTLEGELFEGSFLNGNGRFLLRGLPTGEYLLATNTGGAELIDELYRDVPRRPGGLQPSDFSLATPVPVSLGETTAGLRFDLDATGTLSGHISDDTGQPAVATTLVLMNSEGNPVDFGYVEPSGRYTVRNLLPGSYFLRTESFDGVIDELYEDIPCRLTSELECDPTTGRPITIASGVTTQVDMVLQRGGVISGHVRSAVTGRPLQFTIVNVFRNGHFEGHGLTDDRGFYQVEALESGSYTASTQVSTTSSYNGELDQLYDGIPCTFGGLYACEPAQGNPIPVVAGQETSGIDFLLTAPGPFTCVPTATTLCLQAGRFRVDAGFFNPDRPGFDLAHSRPITADTGTFWFRRPENLELVVKVLDTCAASGFFSVYAAGLTNSAAEIVVTDSATGEQRVYHHSGSSPFPPIQDTRALATCGAERADPPER